MRKVVGTGETILDILFLQGQPVAAVPGGSSFNSIISTGRAGVPCIFVGYTGNDAVGRQTVEFMQRNGVRTDFFEVRNDEKSALSLAFLDEHGDADYTFYKTSPRAGTQWTLPPFSSGDVMLYGSYYAACTGTRPMIEEMLERANSAGAIVYYDLNFRRSHLHELAALTPTIQSNFRQSSIVRGSADDFEVMFATRDARQIYSQHISSFCPFFICTSGADAVTVCTPTGAYDYEVPPVTDVVSTVGAGDNFNAGFACALIWEGFGLADLPKLKRDEWERLVRTACIFAGEACRSTDNYISAEFGAQLAACR